MWGICSGVHTVLVYPFAIQCHVEAIHLNKNERERYIDYDLILYPFWEGQEMPSCSIIIQYISPFLNALLVISWKMM